MKKNKMMRLASGLLVAVLLTTSMISGTYAKYVTTASGSDSARVAKWGVEVYADASDAFMNEYASHDTATYAGVTVKSIDDKKVVAPGTSSADITDGAFVFSISGTPEVATEVSIDITSLSDVYLANGTYTDWTQSPYDKTFTLAEADVATRTVQGYYPVKWTLVVDDENPDVTTTLANKVSFDELNEVLNTYIDAAVYGPNEKLDATFTLTWEWAFSGNDKADTLLGNIAAGTETTVATSAYNLITGFDFSITVTQVD